MITADDSRHTLELPDFYIICPEFAWWGRESWDGSVPVEEGFSYSSDRNDKWLTVEVLKKIMINKY